MPAALPILYCDDDFIAVIKPPGMFVHRTELDQRERAVVLQTVRDQLRHPVFLIHRLDRPTSGIVLLGLSSSAAAAASELFRDRKVTKEYVALVRGWSPERTTIDRPLTSPEVVRDEPLPAVTDLCTDQRFEVRQPWNGFPTTRCSLLRATPRTGRFHQIRRHLNGISYPVIGDTSHGDSRCNQHFREHLGVTRLMLHASRLQFSHPWTGKTVHIHAPLPDDMQQVTSRLECEMTD